MTIQEPNLQPKPNDLELEEGDILELFHRGRALGTFEVVSTFFGESACIKRQSDSFQIYIPCRWISCSEGFRAEEFTISYVKRSHAK